tara:strand:- start:1338 stop:1856 length:519 start_codon:yes stop_codon:yes gene_type:complete
MKIKNIINIFYFLTILNYVLHNKLNCLITLLGLHIIFYVVFKNDTKSKLLSIIGSMFLFCGYSIETMKEGLENECTEEIEESCKENDKVCIEGVCEEKICTDEKKEECNKENSICKEKNPRGCKKKKKEENNILTVTSQKDASSLKDQYNPRKGVDVGSRVLPLNSGLYPLR